MTPLSFVIYSPDFDERVGGSIVLHRLCDLLNRIGAKAYLYPIRPHIDMRSPVVSFRHVMRHLVRQHASGGFKTFSGFKTPVVSFRVPRNAIVIYPEVISGNPLGARNVVRWLLHKPGFHSGIVDFDPSDVLFYFQEAFNNHDLKLKSGGELRVFHLRTDIYKNLNSSSRSGTCYLLRKGKGRRIVHDLSNSILIDDLPHEEVARIFNRCESFISYDSYTLYSQYAALCGCMSIVVPESGVAKEVWQPDEHLRLGISYGFDELDWAKETQGQVAGYLNSHQVAELQSVEKFVSFCRGYFN